jgi:hypothetical protein
MCQPSIAGLPQLCDVPTGLGCIPGQTCAATPNGVCLDPTSSQFDGTPSSLPFTLAQNTEFGIRRESEPNVYDEAFVLPTNKFDSPTARTVHAMSLFRHGNDFSPGPGWLLIWGRPGLVGEGTRQAQLYLMVHPLPLPVDRTGHVTFHPFYFAGIDSKTHEPAWSPLEVDAAPLAMDGQVGGDPHEALPIPNQTAINWLGPPVNKWMMLYGGDVPDALLSDPANARPGPEPGSIRVRFADFPWGPWSPAVPHFSPGDPAVAGDPYGPGGFLYDNQCVDQGSLTCTPSDPSRPGDIFNPNCAPPPVQTDIGRLYGSNIIDAYTRPDHHGGIDVFWNLSTWNPYGVMLAKTNVRP